MILVKMNIAIAIRVSVQNAIAQSSWTI